MDVCNPECHRLERAILLADVEIAIRLILDGDDEHIRAVLEAIADLPKAA